MEDEEVWMPLTDYCGIYEISNFGRIKSLSRSIKTAQGSRVTKERIMLHRKDKDGYCLINLSKNRRYETAKVHRLVARSFIANPQNKPEVNHIDGNKSNNRSNNLEWATGKENCRHKILNNLQISLKGEDSPASKLSEIKVVAIKRLLRIKPSTSIRGLARKVNMHPSTILSIAKGKNWKHVA